MKVSYPLNNFMTKHFPCPSRLCIDSKDFSLNAIEYPAH